jgi:lysophospholipid acyltransferase (LPLAT)-like uncharacterized protein
VNHNPRRWWHPYAASFLKFFLACYVRTWRVTFIGKEEVIEHLKTSPVGSVFLLWHDSLLMALTLQFLSHHQPLHVLVSNSHDGDIAAEIAIRYPGIRVLRVKHFARAQALLESCHLLQSRKSLFLTPDGPRGPRHVMKPGASYAAEKAGATTFFITCTPSRFISLNSWDKFMIPLPFTKVKISFSTSMPNTAE